MWVGRVGWTECVRLVSTVSTHVFLNNEVAFSKVQSKKSKISRTRISLDLYFSLDLCASPNDDDDDDDDADDDDEDEDDDDEDDADDGD